MLAKQDLLCIDLISSMNGSCVEKSCGTASSASCLGKDSLLRDKQRIVPNSCLWGEIRTVAVR